MKIAGKNILERFGDAIHVLAGKSIGVSLADWGKGDAADSSTGKLVSAYQQSSWIFSCINVIADQLAQIPFRVSRNSATPLRARQHRWRARAMGEDLVETGPLFDLLARPHPNLTRFDFWRLVVSWLMLRGDSFIIPTGDDLLPVPLIPGRAGRSIRRLNIISPDLIREVISANALINWSLFSNTNEPLPSLELLPEEVLFARIPNPYYFWRGLGPLTIARLAAQTDFAAANFMRGTMENNADTGLIVSSDGFPDDAQRAQILVALRERKRKAGTADRPLFLGGGIKVQAPTVTVADMQFLENRKFNRQEICAIFRTPQEILGFTEDANRSVSDSARLNFIENTISPICELLEAVFEPLARAFDPSFYAWFDLDSLPIMQRARQTRFTTAKDAMTTMGVPLNVVNGLFDLGLPDDLPHGEKVFLPFNLQEFGAPEPLPSEDNTQTPDASTQTPNTDSANPFTRMGRLLSGLQTLDSGLKTVDVVALWKKHITARRAAIKLFQGKVAKILLKYRGKTLAKLDEVHLQKSQTLDPGPQTRGLVDIIFSASEFGEALATELNSPLRALLQTSGEELMAEVGNDDPWEYPPKAVLEFLAARKQKIMGVGGTARDQLNTSLMEGVEAGETHAQLVDRVKAVFTNLSDYEARRVAMTEVNIGYNTARQEAMSKAGIEYKAWLSSHGPHVRPAHAEAESMYIDDPIPIDEPFEVMGEQLMFPGDDSLGASLENIINCQCIQLAAQKKSEDEKTLTFKIFGIGEMVFPRRQTPNPRPQSK